MTAKEIEFGMDCLERIVAGVDCIACTVGSTLGPKGRLAVLEHDPARPVVTKGGAIVARGICGCTVAIGECGDLDDMGVVDALKVVRLALQNAASVDGLC